MALHEHEKGSSIYVDGYFTDPLNSDAPINPTSVALVVTAPDATATTVSSGDITNVATGQYRYVLALSQEGTYRWKWTGTTGPRVVVIPGSCDSVDHGA